MSLFRTIVFTATVAGIIAGLVLTAVQYVSTVPLILKAETYETAAAPAAPANPATPAPAATAPSASVHEHAHAHSPAANAAASEHHHDGGWTPADGFERTAYTLLANIVGAIGIALILVALSEITGGLRGWREGVFWGLAGFAAFTLAPSIGMAPDPPGMPAADLFARQAWFVATVVLTGAGIALLMLQKSFIGAVIGLVLIIGPHIVGAPKPEHFETAVPHALTHDFVVAVIMSSLVFWVVLGAFAGFFRARLGHGAA
jgi:cobalt transporter subunit CbtA